MDYLKITLYIYKYIIIIIINNNGLTSSSSNSSTKPSISSSALTLICSSNSLIDSDALSTKTQVYTCIFRINNHGTKVLVDQSLLGLTSFKCLIGTDILIFG